MSSVVYLRVPDSLKQALAARARERGLSLTGALVALLERSLDASEEERAGERERELAASASELAQTRARLAEAELRLQAAQEREELVARTYGALAERARGELALCPQCGKPLRDSDLLVSGHRPNPNCKRAITTLLTPRPQTGAPNPDAYLALLGALGGLVGLALASTTAAAPAKKEAERLGTSRLASPATEDTLHPPTLSRFAGTATLRPSFADCCRGWLACYCRAGPVSESEYRSWFAPSAARS